MISEAYHSRWANSLQSGEVTSSLCDMERGIRLYAPARHHAYAYRYVGHDPEVCARGESAIALWFVRLATGLNREWGGDGSWRTRPPWHMQPGGRRWSSACLRYQGMPRGGGTDH